MKSAGAVRGRRTPFIQRREDRRAAVAAARVHALARRGGLGMGRASPALGQNEGSQGSSLAASEYAWTCTSAYVVSYLEALCTLYILKSMEICRPSYLVP